MTRPKRVALFVTCLVDQIMPDVGVATVRLLRRAGFSVDFPEAQTCCGQPFFNSGFRAEARDLADKTVALLEGYDAVVLPSGSCTTMIKVEYPHLLLDEPARHAQAVALAARTYELTQFLVQFAPDLLAGASGGATVTYHDSCHMCRLLGEREAPRQMLRSAGHDIVEMAEADRCCGFGGLFSVRMPEIANAMSVEKLRQAADTGAGLLVSADPGCLMQLRGLLGSDQQAVHVATLLAEALP